MFPYSNKETINSVTLCLIVLILPFILITISYTWHVYISESLPNTRNSPQDLQIRKIFYFADTIDAILSYTLSLLLSANLTNFLKITVGRPRPDTFNRCFPTKSLNSIRNRLFLNSLPISPFRYNCENENLMDDAFKSFPSGHSAYIAAACGFCSLYICGKCSTFCYFNRRNFKKDGCVSARFVFGIMPFFLLAIYVGITRIQDYRHHIEDVLIGLFLGWFIALVIYRFYYPPITQGYKSKFSLRQLSLLEDEIE